jgi:hypothetical protein
MQIRPPDEKVLLQQLVRAIVLAAVAVSILAVGLLVARDREATETAARSDRFWELLAVNGSPMAHFDRLDAMADESDLVVVGRIVRVAPGREVRDLDAEAEGYAREEASVYFADATLVVDEALKGDAGKDVKLQLLLPQPGVLEQVQADLPSERGIYFLRDMGAYFAKENPESGLATTLEDTFDFVSPQGLIRDLNGAVGVTADEGDTFLHALSRRTFTEVLADARLAAAD